MPTVCEAMSCARGELRMGSGTSRFGERVEKNNGECLSWGRKGAASSCVDYREGSAYPGRCNLAMIKAFSSWYRKCSKTVTRWIPLIAPCLALACPRCSRVPKVRWRDMNSTTPPKRRLDARTIKVDFHNQVGKPRSTFSN